MIQIRVGHPEFFDISTMFVLRGRPLSYSRSGEMKRSPLSSVAIFGKQLFCLSLE
jgi:hypothetical protein